MDMPHQVGHVVGPWIGTPQDQEQNIKVINLQFNRDLCSLAELFLT